MNYSIVENGVVVNVVVADSPMTANWIEGNFGIGSTYNAQTGVFTAPVAPEPEPEVAPINEWWIYVGPLFDRFGALKIPILASADLTVQAVIKDVMVRKYIDLKRADVAQALDLLIAKGFAINKTAILTTPVPEADRYADHG